MKTGGFPEPAPIALPRTFLAAVIFICLLPTALNFLGWNFSSLEAGNYVHTIMEWSAFCVAVFTVILAFLHYSMRGEVATLIIGLALFFAGLMDALHILAADHLIGEVLNNPNFVALTGAIRRFFTALIIVLGALIFLVRGAYRPKASPRLLLLASLGLGALAYAIIWILGNMEHLPQAIFPSSLITRPYDLAALLVFLIGGLLVMPRFYRKAPSFLSQALAISFIPQIVTQLHMVFGSSALFDNHYNISHFLKVVAYLVPFAGLSLDYLKTYQQLDNEISERRRAEEALRQEEERLLASIFSSVQDGLYILDDQFTIIRVNPIMEQWYAHNMPLAGQKCFAALARRTEPCKGCPCRRAMETGVGANAEVPRMGAQGQEGWMDVYSFPLLDSATGRVKAVIQFLRDITEHKRAEEARAQLAEILEATTDLVATADSHGGLLYLNQAGRRLLGIGADEDISGLTISSAHSAGAAEIILNEALPAARQQGVWVGETVFQARDGREFPASQVILVHRTLAGEEKFLSTIARDITEHQRAERALQESEKKYRLLVSQIPAMVFQGYGDWSIDPLDDKVEVLTGYSKEDFESRRVKWCDLIPAEDLDYAAKVFIEALKTDKSYVREHRLRKKDGEIIWVQCRGQIFLNDQGKVDHISGVSFDVTQRRQAEEAVSEGERFLADIFASIQDGINIMDPDYNIIRVNPTFEGWFDHARPLAGRKCYEALHGRQEPCEVCSYRQTLETGQVGHKLTPRKGKDGEEPAWMEIFTFPITDRATGQVKGVIEYARDITEQKQAVAALRESEVWLKTILDNVQTGILVIEPETKAIVDVNPAAAKMIGASKEQIIGSSCQQNICSAEKGKCPITDLGQAVDNSEQLLIRPDGERRNIIKTVVPATLGGRTYLLESFIDITERQKAEEALRQSEEQLRQAVKLEAVGRLAGGVAHDFNNILTAITGYGELLLMNLAPQDSVRQDVKDILVAAERAASLTRQLLAFSRKQVLQPHRLDLNRVVANMDKMLRRIIGEDIDLATVLGPELGTVTADPGQIEQVIMNLAVNARDAMPQGGTLTIETADVDLDEAYARNHLEAQPGLYVMLAVSDTGVGLDQEAQARIFEPFFTTKEFGKGTGLGLSTVYGIVKQSGGLIWVYSEPGNGSTFRIYLPRFEGPGDVAELSQVPGKCEWGSETILLVEDEDMVRQVARRILARHGYSVLEAASGDNALVVSREHAGPIHLMLTDVVMPGMSGQEIMENLKSQRPEMKVLFMSGHTENAIVHHGVLNPGTAFIQKPFKYNVLAHKIREMLDNPPPG